jgi:calpain-15
MDLTGCPTISYNFKDDKVKQMISQGKLWEMLKYYDEEGYIITGGTPPEDLLAEENNEGEEKKSNGLIPGHAYSVIISKEVKGIRLMNLRNPWGGFEWDGDWSD